MKCGALIGIALALSGLAFEAAADSIGPLRPGMLGAEVQQLLGPPAGVAPQPGCEGAPLKELWDYSALGLILVLERDAEVARLTTISSFGRQGPPLHHTPPGSDARQTMTLAIGDGVRRIREVLPTVADLDEPSLEFAIGDQTLSLSLSGTEPPTVTRIGLTDQPALAYDEGDPCPRRLATDPPGP